MATNQEIWRRFCRKEWLLAATMMFGFVLAELPANVRDYTQTDAKYAMENYGGSLASTRLQQAAASVPCPHC